MRARIRSTVGAGDDLVRSCRTSSWWTALSLLFTLRQGLRRRNSYSLRSFFFFVQTTIHPSTNFSLCLTLEHIRTGTHTLSPSLPRLFPTHSSGFLENGERQGEGSALGDPRTPTKLTAANWKRKRTRRGSFVPFDPSFSFPSETAGSCRDLYGNRSVEMASVKLSVTWRL